MTIYRAAGLQLARDIPASEPGQMPLLRSGAKITERYCRALAEAGIHAVWVHDPVSMGIEPHDLVPPQVREEAAKTVSDALAGARVAIENGQGLSPEFAQELSEIVARLVAAVAGHSGVALCLNDLAAADAYTHQHSIDVCALGLLLGKYLFARDGWEDYKGRHRIDGVDKRLHLLGMGLLLHDIGKLAVPAGILNKPGKLTEMKVMQTHPDVGATMLTSGIYSPLVRAIVREHHERWDGKGYPRGLSGSHISQLARIAAVADVYDAVTSERPYRPAQAPKVGVDVVTSAAGTQFDPEVVAVFRRLVFPYPVGSEIVLANGTTGVVAEIDPDDPERPLIRFADAERHVDLRVERLAA